MKTRQVNTKIKRLDWIIRFLVVAIFATALSILFVFLPKEDDANTFRVRTMMLYDAYVGQPYNLTLEAINGRSPYTFEVSGLPEGLLYDAETQSITGTALNAGNTEVEVKVTDADKKTNTVKYKFAVATDVPELVSPASVSAGRYYSAAILENGDLITFGENNDGQLGRAGEDIIEKALVNVRSVSASGSTTMALRKDGTLWAFGKNSDGQFGNGSTNSSHQPVFIMDGVAAVSGASSYTMIIKDDGTLWAFGSNKQYQLGSDAASSQPKKLLDNVAAVSCGEYTAVALRKDGTVWSWGQNTHGEAGIPDGSEFVKEPTQVPGISDIVTVSSGYGHTLALQSDGTLWAWGYNAHGQIGNGGTDDVFSPVQVMTDVRNMSGGADHSLAVTNSGELWGAGSNEYGQLSSAETETSSFVKLMDGVQAAYAGGAHSLILMPDSTLLAVGRNDFGQIGVGEPAQVHEPVKSLENVILY